MTRGRTPAEGGATPGAAVAAPAAGVIDPERLARATRQANIPILLMVLHQLTGSDRWLQDPYLPSRARGMGTNDSGGLDPQIQDEIRTAAREAILAWSAGSDPALPSPGGEELTRMLAVCVGEDVPAEYGDLLAREMGFVDPRQGSGGSVEGGHVDAIIVGAGVSGLAASVKLSTAGLEHVILEKEEDLGGTWFHNRYPGAGVDTPSYLYEFSFYQHRWETYFGTRAQVHDYLSSLANEFDLRRRIRFGCTVLRARFDEARQRWSVTYRDADGQEVTRSARILITAVGQLSRPHIPDIPGLHDFTGELFHSAEWPTDAEIDGKRVAVVGTGASAMQIVPAIVDRVSELIVVQRSPQWIAPNDDVFERIDDDTHWLMEHVPYYRSWYRAILWWTFGDRIHDSLQIDPHWPHPERSVNQVNDGHRAFFTRYLEEKLDGRPDLKEKALPTYPPFGKRMLIDNGWYDALRHDNCCLVDSPVAQLTSEGFVVDDGRSFDVDVIVMATGFEAKKMLAPMEILGRDGVSIRDEWGDDSPAAYLGMTVPRFPNFFVMYGPNTNLGHGGSYIFLAECQVDYLIDLLLQVRQNDIGAFECRQEVFDEYNRKVEEAHRGLIWSHQGMDTWYRNSEGKVVTNAPWRLVDYWKMTRSADLHDYRLEPLNREHVAPDGSA